jgi:ribosomal protein L37E
MKTVKVCSACGVPKEISGSSRWENNGTINALRTPGQRSLLYEVEGIDGLFRNIEQLVGQSVNRVIAEGKRKNTLQFLEGYFSGIMGALVRTTMGRRRVYTTVASLGAIFGYGHFEVRDIKRGEHVTIYGRNVYCMPLFTGDLLATFNVIERLPASVLIEGEDGGYMITVKRAEKLEEELSSRLEPVILTPKPGNIHFDTCSSCGAPIDLKEWDFDLEEGIITDSTTGRRMASLGIEQVDAVLRELEAELGEEFAAVVLQAQRDYTVSKLGKEEMAKGRSYLRLFLALRGMGNLVEYEHDDIRLKATVENARPPLLVAGILYGIFELLTGRESSIDYTLQDDGTLDVRVEAS